MGLVVDFNKLKAMIQFIIAPFENDQLEKFDPFTNINSSAENLAKYIYSKLKPMLWAGLKLNFVEVMEAPDCWARYS
jgi:6-pyruvoyltetrahydropterin/6-carboxytetrahydropterin synthase